jgi:hypothetical protein
MGKLLPSNSKLTVCLTFDLVYSLHMPPCGRRGTAFPLLLLFFDSEVIFTSDQALAESSKAFCHWWLCGQRNLEFIDVLKEILVLHRKQNNNFQFVELCTPVYGVPFTYIASDHTGEDEPDRKPPGCYCSHIRIGQTSTCFKPTRPMPA